MDSQIHDTAQDIVVEAGPASLMVGYDVQFKIVVTVTENADRQGSKIILGCLRTTAISHVTATVAHCTMLVVVQVQRQPSLQRAFDNGFGQLL